MHETPTPLFAFSENDHLIRIHLLLELEDLGFVVVENCDTLMLVDGIGRP